MTKIEMLFKAREVWNDRDRLIDLREDWGNEHGCDETYRKMQSDIERMAEEATSLEQGIDPQYKTVVIPVCEQHEGIFSKHVKVKWVCPVCGGPRGEPYKTISYDGSRRLGVDGWVNLCGHVDLYAMVREEAEENQSEGSDNTMAAQLSDAGFGSGGPQ